MNIIKSIDYSIIDLANKIIEQAQSRNIRLGLTKLQKLVYYVYGEYLAQENIRLVKDDEPQKWPHGPVFFQLYKKTKTMGMIDKINCETLETLENIEIKKDKKLNKTKLDKIITEVFIKHGQKTTTKLIKDVCIKGYAWDNTDDFPNTLLDEDIINEFSDRKKNRK